MDYLQSGFTIPHHEAPARLSVLQYNTSSPLKRIKYFFNNSRKVPFILLLIFIVLLTFFAIQKTLSQSSPANSVPQVDGRVTLNNPIFKQTINKSFTFPLLDQNGKEVSKFTYTVDSVEVRDQIIVKGQQATAVQGKRFFITNVKLTNNFDKTITVNARDYLRVIVAGSAEKLAPDMHSDPVDIQPISTKPTRLGLTINDTDKKIALQVGEINGKKEIIHLNLK